MFDQVDIRGARTCSQTCSSPLFNWRAGTRRVNGIIAQPAFFSLSLSKFQISSHFHYHIPPSLFTVTVRVNCAIRKYPTVQPDFFHFHFQIITFVFNFAFTSYFHISFFNTFQPGKEYMASLTMVRQFFTFTFSNQIFKFHFYFHFYQFSTGGGMNIERTSLASVTTLRCFKDYQQNIMNRICCS